MKVGSRWIVARQRSLLPLGIAIGLLLVGGLLHWLGRGATGDLLWIIVTAWGIALSLYSITRSLLRGRLGVDAIALLALVGAVAIGEYLAGAVISVMLASGRALDGWAAGQARRELQHWSNEHRSPLTATRTVP